jgi:dipeptidyl aminopeptidase/acylaminoacyl peptidase
MLRGSFLLTPLVYLLVAAAPTAAAEPAAVDGQLFTPREVVTLERVIAAEMSPDGRSIAYLLRVPRALDEEDAPADVELHVVDVATGASRPFVTGDVSVSEPSWSPDGRFISYLARRGEDEHRGLYVIPAAGGESIRIVDHDARLLDYDWRPDGRRVAFVAEEPQGEREGELVEQGFDAEIFEEDWTRHGIWIAEFDPEALAADPEPRRLETSFTGQPWHVVYHPNGQRLLTDPSPTTLIDDRYMFRRLVVVAVDTGATVAQFDNPGKLGSFGWSPDGEHVALISAADLNDPSAGRLLVADVSGGELRDVVPELLDTGQLEDFAFAADGTLVYLASVGVRSRIGRVALDGTEGRILVDGGETVFYSLSSDRGGDRLALTGETDRHPREVFALAPDAPPRRLTRVNPGLEKMAFARQEAITWKARDGLSIEGLLIHPLRREGDERVPLIVVAHGGPEAHYLDGWLTRYHTPGQVAAARGYAVLYPNYRSSTGRGVAFSKAGQGDTGGGEFDDVLAGIDHLVAEGLVDGDRVGITGGSYGGFFTAWGATRHTERFAAGVMFVGVTNQISKWGTTDIPREMELVHWMGTPWDDLEHARQRSPVYWAHQSQTPLLILHGRKDTRVSPTQSLELYRALAHRGETPVRLVFYPREGHGNRRTAAQYDYMLRMMRWFETFLLEGAEDKPPYRLDYGLEEDSPDSGGNGSSSGP